MKRTNHIPLHVAAFMIAVFSCITALAQTHVNGLLGDDAPQHGKLPLLEELSVPSSEAADAYGCDTTGSWSLERCIAYALEHNIDIMRQELDVETRRVGVSESGWAFSPSVGVSLGGSVSTGRVLDQTTYQFVKNKTIGYTSASASGSMELFSGFRKIYNLRYSRTSLLQGESELEVRRREITRSVTAGYLSLLCAESALETATLARELIQAQTGRIESLVELGRVTQSDLMQAKVQLFNADKEIATARGEVEMARVELCNLLNLTCSDAFHIEGSTVDELPLCPPMLDEGMLEMLPEFRSASLELDLAGRELRIARSAYWPTISLSAGYGSNSSSDRQKTLQNTDGTYRYEAYPIREQYVDNANAYVSVSLNIPIFSGLATRNSVRRKEIAVKDAEFALHSRRMELVKEYRQARTDCETAYQNFLTSREQLQYAGKAEEETRERYNLGRADFNTWNTAVTELAKARYSLAESEYTYIFMVKMLRMFER